MARTFYDVLMVNPAADRELIAVVYRHLAKRYHPDHDDSPAAAARMAELNEAYAVLGDAEKRARYDEQMGLRSTTPRVLGGDGRASRSGMGSTSASASSPYGEAGAPPRTPPASGSTLDFGRYKGWALNQVARFDRDYLEWLSRTTMGRSYRQELDELLRRP